MRTRERCTSDCFRFFFFNDTATTEIYTLSLHDALPIWRISSWPRISPAAPPKRWTTLSFTEKLSGRSSKRSEEHTSELQSRQYLVCRLLLEKKKKTELSQSDLTNASSLMTLSLYNCLSQ